MSFNTPDFFRSDYKRVKDIISEETEVQITQEAFWRCPYFIHFMRKPSLLFLN